jgi:hypothetical protein
MASQNGGKQMVADLVCEFRGSKKPTEAQWDNRDVSKGTRGTYPENMANCWGAEKDEDLDPQFVNSFGVRVWLAALFWLLA